MNASAFRDLWARVTFWKFSIQFENFQNITSDHKSRNARAGSYDFLFIIFSTKLLKGATLYAWRTLSNTSMVSNMHTCFIWTNQKYNVVTRKSSVKFLKDFEKIQKISRKLNFRLLKAAKVRKSVFNSSISIGLCDLQTLVSCIAPEPR